MDAFDTWAHDPKEFVRGMQQILISDTKRVGFLTGAGTSISVKKGAANESRVPGVKEMTSLILDAMDNDKFGQAINEMKEEFAESNTPFLIEYILSSIAQKEIVVGKGTLCGLMKSGFGDFREAIEKEIVKHVSVHNEYDKFIDNLVHCDFAIWLGSAPRKFGVEIFTTNYDFLFEIGLEKNNIAYFDGFVGGFRPFFDPVYVEDMRLLPTWTKLWKLHGSLGWDFDNKEKKIVKGSSDTSKIIVFPSIMKYDNSRKQPYISFMDRLGNFLKADDGVLFICGYSFGDQHINDVILNGLSKTRSSRAIALYFDDFDERSEITMLGKREPNLSIYGKRHAVIGGKFGSWKLSAKPSKDDAIQIDTYFDEDAVAPDTDWVGSGELKLVYFQSFVEFLSLLQYESYRVRNVGQ